MKSTMTKTLLVTALATGLSVASTSAMAEVFPDLKAHESAAPGSVTNFLTADMQSIHATRQIRTKNLLFRIVIPELLYYTQLTFKESSGH